MTTEQDPVATATVDVIAPAMWREPAGNDACGWKPEGGE